MFKVNSKVTRTTPGVTCTCTFIHVHIYWLLMMHWTIDHTITSQDIIATPTLKPTLNHL